MIQLSAPDLSPSRRQAWVLTEDRQGGPAARRLRASARPRAASFLRPRLFTLVTNGPPGLRKLTSESNCYVEVHTLPACDAVTWGFAARCRCVHTCSHIEFRARAAESGRFVPSLLAGHSCPLKSDFGTPAKRWSYKGSRVCLLHYRTQKPATPAHYTVFRESGPARSGQVGVFRGDSTFCP